MRFGCLQWSSLEKHGYTYRINYRKKRYHNPDNENAINGILITSYILYIAYDDCVTSYQNNTTIIESPMWYKERLSVFVTCTHSFANLNCSIIFGHYQTAHVTPHVPIIGQCALIILFDSIQSAWHVLHPYFQTCFFIISFATLSSYIHCNKPRK